MFTHGTADPFGSIDELRAAAARIPAPSEIVEVTGALATTQVPRRSMCRSWRWTRRYGCCRPARWVALVDEGIHAFPSLLVGEARGNHPRRELVGLRHTEIHLRIEGALARRELHRRLLGELPCQPVGLRDETFGRHAVDQPQSSAWCASTMSPVSSISIARLRDTLRPTATPAVEQKKPRSRRAW